MPSGFDAVKDEPLHVYETGANRSDRTGKGRFDLIPPSALLRVAKHYENGAVVHGERNWEAGFPFSRALDSLERHLCQFKDGDTTEDHLAAIVWQAFAVMHFQTMIERNRLPAGLNDLPEYGPGPGQQEVTLELGLNAYVQKLREEYPIAAPDQPLGADVAYLKTLPESEIPEANAPT